MSQRKTTVERIAPHHATSLVESIRIFPEDCADSITGPPGLSEERIMLLFAPRAYRVPATALSLLRICLIEDLYAQLIQANRCSTLSGFRLMFYSAQRPCRFLHRHFHVQWHLCVTANCDRCLIPRALHH